MALNRQSTSLAVPPGRQFSIVLSRSAPDASHGHHGNQYASLRATAPARGVRGGAGRSLKAEQGYGVALFGERFTGTPDAGLGLSDGGGHGVMLRSLIRW